MDWKDMISLAATQGLGVVLSVGVIFYVLRENTKREERLITVIEKHLAIIDVSIANLGKQMVEHDSRVSAIALSMQDANRYQRDEHVGMMKILNEMLVEVKANYNHGFVKQGG